MELVDQRAQLLQARVDLTFLFFQEVGHRLTLTEIGDFRQRPARTVALRRAQRAP
jgi:hypothetical protein